MHPNKPAPFLGTLWQLISSWGIIVTLLVPCKNFPWIFGEVGGNFVVLEIFLGVSHSNWYLIFWHSLLLFKLLLSVKVTNNGKVHLVTWEGSYAAQLFLLQLLSCCSKVQFESCSLNKCLCAEVVGLLRQGTQFSTSKFSSVFLSWSDPYRFLLLRFCFMLYQLAGLCNFFCGVSLLYRDI